MDYKESLYRHYVSTHLAPRKGTVDSKEFRTKAKIHAQHMGRLLPRDKQARILDLGCGSGSLLWWLQSLGYARCEGVDVSAEQVAVAHSLGLANVVESDLLAHLRNGGEPFDAIIARDVLEHFDKQSVFDVLCAAHDRLAEDGLMIIQVPNGCSPFAGRIRYGDFTHELAFTPSSIHQVFAAAGFSHIRVLPARPAVTGARSALRHLAWRLFEPLLKLCIDLESPGGGKVVTINLIAVAGR